MLARKERQESDRGLHPTRFSFRALIFVCALPVAALTLLVILDDYSIAPPSPRLRYHGALIAELWVLYAGAMVGLWLIANFRRATRFLITRRKHLLLALGSALLGLLIAEVALRQVKPVMKRPSLHAPPSRVLHHAYPPNARMYGGMSEAHAISIKTNEDGLRSAYTREAFLQYGHRIVVLGDSFTFGLGVEGDQAFPAVLEGSLRNLTGSDDIAVLNTGVVSYSPLLENRFLRQIGHVYRPTLTILVLDLTDIGDDYQYENQLVVDDSGQYVFDVEETVSGVGLFSGVALLKPVRTFVRKLLKPMGNLREAIRSHLEVNPEDDADFVVEIDGALEISRFFILRHPLTHTRPYFERTLTYIRRAAEEAAGIGSEFLLVVAPRFHQWSDRECPDNWEASHYAIDEPYEFEYFRFFEQAAPTLGFEVLNLLPAFERSTVFPCVFREDPHWNAAGHGLVGETLAAYVRENYLSE